MKRVIVGLSGGVDSSVAAYLLKEQGYEVIGLFMKNWHDDSVTISDECPWLEDSNDALLVAEKLGIPFQTVDLSEQYKERIVDYMFDEYKKGRTPNPDVLCNREIKFDVFMKIALDLGADYVATGHYCRKSTTVINGKETHHLLAGIDPNKDQSYFLCQLSQKQLAKTLFPVGELLKPKVREIAASQNLITANKKDSQGLCFIGKVRLPEFLQQQLKQKEGVIIEIDANNSIYKNKDEYALHNFIYSPENGKKVGNHIGAHYYTKGQRKGLAVGGTPLPLFVLETDVKTNTIYVGQGKNHPGISRKGLLVTQDEIHWVRPDLTLKLNESLKVKARIRYRQNLENAILTLTEKGLEIIFTKSQFSIQEGQFVAWYINNELIGSGVIA